jgi:GxxExxY protein
MGCGFLEAIYHECLEIEFGRRGIPFVSKAILPVEFKGQTLRTYYQADFVCWDKIIIEIKATSTLADEHTAQLLNYLNAVRKPLGLIVNFGHYPKLQSKRVALTDLRP